MGHPQLAQLFTDCAVTVTERLSALPHDADCFAAQLGTAPDEVKHPSLSNEQSPPIDNLTTGLFVETLLCLTRSYGLELNHMQEYTEAIAYAESFVEGAQALLSQVQKTMANVEGLADIEGDHALVIETTMATAAVEFLTVTVKGYINPACTCSVTKHAQMFGPTPRLKPLHCGLIYPQSYGLPLFPPDSGLLSYTTGNPERESTIITFAFEHDRATQRKLVWMNDNISLAMHKFPPRVLGDFGKTDKSARHMEIATGLLVYQFRALNNLPNSRKSIDELESVDISDMICPLRAHGKKLTVRVLSPVRICGGDLLMALEDVQGYAIRLNIEFPLPDFTVYYPQALLQQLYPIGSTLTIKEPALRFSQLDLLPELHVSVPCDIVLEWGDAGLAWTDRDNVTCPEISLEEGKAMASDLLLKQKETLLAPRQYERMLSAKDITPALHLSALLNHSYTSLLLDLPGSALRDLLAASRDHKVDDAQKAKIAGRIRTACADLGIDLATKQPLPEQERDADLWIQRFENGSWASFAKRDIEMGELIATETSYLVIQDPHEARWEFWYLPHEKALPRTSNQLRAIAKSIHQLIDNPLKAAAWAGLHPRRGDFDVTASFDVAECLASQYCISPKEVSDKLAMNGRGKPFVGKIGLDLYGREKGAFGLQLTDAKVNHDCVANTLEVQNKRWALTNIKAGDEITNTYLPAPSEYGLRQAATKSIWGFECTCDLCQLDAKDDHTSRSRMTTADEGLSTATRLQLIRRLQATYAEDRLLRPAVAMHSAHIARDKTLPAVDRFKYFNDFIRYAGFKLASADDLRRGKSPISDLRQAAFAFGELAQSIVECVPPIMRLLSSDSYTKAQLEGYGELLNMAADLYFKAQGTSRSQLARTEQTAPKLRPQGASTEKTAPKLDMPDWAVDKPKWVVDMVNKAARIAADKLLAGEKSISKDEYMRLMNDMTLDD